MKKKFLFFIMILSFFFMISCGGGSESCEQNEDCASGFVCDQAVHECVPENSAN